ncbi:MAG TPA: aminotransferase class V-fold PLP-dependent enzyme [Novosphingobium sp.]|nr:aminotransferase class V-fold PLP-dependent enzyme [Novosphingobium sp.]
MAFYAMSFKPGDRILTGHGGYASNVITSLEVAARTGAVVEAADDDEHGQLPVCDLSRRLKDSRGGEVKLIAMTHVPADRVCRMP